MVNINQNVDDVIQQIRHNDMAADNNLAAMVERIMARNGVNFVLRMPNYTSPLSEDILQIDIPPRTKIPKFTKFFRDTTESTIKHVARYIIEVGDISNNENLRIKYFPSSLTKNTFTRFRTLPQNSIHTWNQLERMFHELFYMGQMKISLKELASIEQKFTEPIDDYLNIFRLLKARCFTQVSEHELVEMAAGGLDYSIKKKLDTQYLRDMARLDDRVRQLERLKEEKARENKNKRVAYIEFNNDDEGSNNESLDFDENEIDLAELKQGPPYSCKVLAPSNGKTPIEPEKNDKFPKKTYTFDVTKCEEIFDLFVKDVQMIVPPGAKMPPLEQRKKRGDLVQNVIQEGRLKFRDKPRSQMKIDSDPLQVADAHYTEPDEVNMVKVADDFNHTITMDEVTKDFVKKVVMVRVSEHHDQEFLKNFINKAVESFTNGTTDGFDTRVTEDSNLMIVTKEIADNFSQID
ncbi:uncharacterized protein LOC127080493 [Lathyrus oleraceus]|uniref:uncharacterized protein LOC127080493 n=1 Tax=Pisum sativum TaxID=3888 RepID=UPI0021D15168|nr:uncharacterized protein LOC127080493 [Pisum sativum]